MIFNGDCLDMLKTIPDQSVKLVVTSPPYNIGKKYEKRLPIDTYIEFQQKVISECVRILRDDGSICWQVGNYVDNGKIIPIDILLYPCFALHNLKLRNRIIWYFGHGLHCSKRFSGRYETILWFTKTDNYTFNLDPVRIPSKYPNKKYFKGPRKGQLSCNPLGKNPSDVWEIPNVKSNHVEKTDHPAQFPVELVQRLILALTNEGDVVYDPFMGVGTTPVACILTGREPMGSEILEHYYHVALERTKSAKDGTIRVRSMNQPIFEPR